MADLLQKIQIFAHGALKMQLCPLSINPVWHGNIVKLNTATVDIAKSAYILRCRTPS